MIKLLRLFTAISLAFLRAQFIAVIDQKNFGRFAAGGFSASPRLRFGATGGFRTPVAPVAPPKIPFISLFIKPPFLPQSHFGKA